MVDLIEIAGSAPTVLPEYTIGEPVESDLVVEARVELRPRVTLPSVEEICRGEVERMSLDAFSEQYGMRAEDIDQVAGVLEPLGLSLLDEGRTCWSVKVRGPAAAVCEAFGVELRYHLDSDGGAHVARTGPVHIPGDLEGIVRAVTGLDRRPTPRGDGAVALDDAALKVEFGKTVVSRTPQDWMVHYQFPSGTGSGQKIGLLEFPASFSDTLVGTAFANLGVSAPVLDLLTVDGAAINPHYAKIGETGLDIVIAGTVARDAGIAVVSGKNLFEDMGPALFAAIVEGGASIVSISYGAPETTPQGAQLNRVWQPMNRLVTNLYFIFAAMVGVTVCVASGDDGSTAGSNEYNGPYVVGFPSSCPLVLACGGTQVVSEFNTLAFEEVWNFPALGKNPAGGSHINIGGGGVSLVFDQPPYQHGIGVPDYPGSKTSGRGTPDLAVAAAFYDFGSGVGSTYLGTSAASPFVAGLIAILNQTLGYQLGHDVIRRFYRIFAEQMNGGTPVFTDITQGNNAPPNRQCFYAKTGWDAASGMGTPLGQAILDALLVPKS